MLREGRSNHSWGLRASFSSGVLATMFRRQDQLGPASEVWGPMDPPNPQEAFRCALTHDRANTPFKSPGHFNSFSPVLSSLLHLYNCWSCHTFKATQKHLFHVRLFHAGLVCCKEQYVQFHKGK